MSARNSARSRSKSGPVGSKMNDAAYPFRGVYQLDKEINHGHSGVGKKQATSLALRVSGSNLLIEQLQAPKGLDLSCEIGIDGGIARPVAFSGGKMALAVPGDGREYNLTAVLKGDNMKHFCKMTFNGSDGKSFFKLRAPENFPKDQVYVIVDGKPVYAAGGYFHIPLQAKDCVIVADIPTNPRTPPTVERLPSPTARRASLPFTPNAALAGANDEDRVPPHFIIETAKGTGDRAVLQCSGTGQMIPLNENQAVAIPATAGPYRLQLPQAPPAPVPDAAAAAPAAPSQLPTATAAPAAVTPTPTTAATETKIPELETRVTTTSIGSMPAYVVTCKGFYVQLKGDNGASVSGFETATLQLPNRYAQRVVITITDAGNKIHMKQTSYVPSTQSPAIVLRVTEDANGMTISGAERCNFTVGATKTNGTTGARLARTSTQRVTAEQVHMDGSASSVALDVGPKPGASASVYGTSNPATSTAAGTQPKPEDQWFTHLAAAVNAPNMDEARRNMQLVRAPNATASQVVSFINDTLFKQPPLITFVAHQDSLKSISCAGYNVSATIGSQQPCLIPANSQVSVPANTQTTLTAVHSKNGRQVAACRILLATAGTGNSMVSPNTLVTSPSDLDAKLMARLLEGLQRGGLEPQRVADDLGSVSVSAYSPTGQRVVPLLISTLKRMPSGTTKEDFFFSCGNGYLSNIYTNNPQYHLSATVDNQQPITVSQRGRVPVTGFITGDGPHFVRLTARDPISNTIKADTTVTVMGKEASQTSMPATAGFQSPFGEGGYPQSNSMPTASAAAPQISDATVSSVIPYVDVVLQQSGPDCIARLSCPPELRIVCNVDGTGGDTGRSDFAAKISGDRPHRVEISLVTSAGKVAFQQKLDVPSMCNTSIWGLALQDNGLALDPEHGCTATVSIDRDTERAVQGNFVSFDAASPHFLLLRKYINGVHGAKAGELALRLPGSASPKDLQELIRLYRGHVLGQLDEPGLKRELFNLHNRCSSPAVKELITLLTQGMGNGAMARPITGPAQGSTAVAPSQSVAAPTGDPNRVYFRLTGNY